METKILLFTLLPLAVILAGVGVYLDIVQSDAVAHLVYVHDQVHEVGIWYADSEGKHGGRFILVLPDSEYANPGKAWPIYEP